MAPRPRPKDSRLTHRQESIEPRNAVVKIADWDLCEATPRSHEDDGHEDVPDGCEITRDGKVLLRLQVVLSTRCADVVIVTTCPWTWTRS